MYRIIKVDPVNSLAAKGHNVLLKMFNRGIMKHRRATESIHNATRKIIASIRLSPKGGTIRQALARHRTI
ncbi:hypothetical protein [Bradyrhizobium sp. Ash2021]|uniref:hypothetical protein n=1 Tax=Bradyrhizobium sp. Ash2021 TaxID=2954771 RepID=UPI002816566B|nr:hypothetical protein [Bradyrhizobium sp. Ash2021]WMT79734.1 hypothetical protein NL528_45630 [Bradyrhizobium sp. Ash2021]